MADFQFKGMLWRWQGNAPAAWHFITLPDDVAGQLKFFSGQRKGFGMLKVKASISGVPWKTSLFPDSKSGSFLLPVKADVRKRAGIADGDTVAVALVYDP
jgi:SOS-response transcriptional repressor LexA